MKSYTADKKELKQEKKVSKGNKVSVGWGMREMNPLVNFFSGIANDPRIGITHIALYSALYQLWAKQHCANSLWIYSYNVLRNWHSMVISGMCHPTIWVHLDFLEMPKRSVCQIQTLILRY